MIENWIELPYKELVNKISTSKQKLKQKEYLSEGAIPVIDQGQDLIGGYTNEKEKLLECKLPAIIFGDHTKIVKLIDFPFAPGADGTKVLQPKNIVLPKLLYYLTPLLVFKIKDKGYARHYQHIEKENFPLPPLPEQRAIVAKIEQLFSELNNGIANLKTAQEQLKVYRQAVLKKAFEGELTNIKEKENEALIAAEPVISYGKSKLPNGWLTEKIDNVCEINPKHTNKNDLPPTMEIQFLPMKLVEEIINKISLSETRRLEEVQKKSYTYFKEGDILFAKVTPCMENGKIAVAQNLKNGVGYGSSEFHVLRCSEKILNDYLFYFLVQDKFRSEAQHAMTGAVGLRRVPKKFLEEYKIPIPPIKEQHKIVQQIESRLSVCDKVEETIAENLQKAEALRQSILKKAFAGELLTEAELAACKEEKDWKPAGELLKKIKKEKPN